MKAKTRLQIWTAPQWPDLGQLELMLHANQSKKQSVGSTNQEQNNDFVCFNFQLRAKTASCSESGE